MLFFIAAFIIGLIICLFTKNKKYGKKIFILAFAVFCVLWLGLCFLIGYRFLDIAILIVEYGFLERCFFYKKSKSLSDKIKEEIYKN